MLENNEKNNDENQAKMIKFMTMNISKDLKDKEVSIEDKLKETEDKLLTIFSRN